MSRFDEIIKIVLGFEGGYSNDPDDPGGKTNYGITEGTLERAKKNGWISSDTDIKTLTVQQAKEIYRHGYWEASKAYLLPAPLDLIMFDCAVNHGVGGAVKLYQKALNSLDITLPLVVDGDFGPKTTQATKDMLKINDELNHMKPELGPWHIVNELAKTMLLYRVKFYVDIIKHRPQNKKFFFGWLSQRVVRLAELSGLL